MEIETQEDFLASFGIENPTPESTDPTPEADQIPEGGVTLQPEGGAEPPINPETGLPEYDLSVFNTSDLVDNPDAGGDETPPDVIPQQQPKPDRASQAFAQMRVENTAYKNTLQNVASILGIEGIQNPVELAEAIKVKAMEAQSKKDNIPLEMLQRLDRLETLEKQFTQSQLQQTTLAGLQTLQNQFKLSDDKLVGFVQTLLSEGINPYETPVDLVNEYRTRNFDALLREAEERGRAAEAARAAKANQHSSNPGTNVGGTPGEQDKITTVKGLDDFFAQVK